MNTLNSTSKRRKVSNQELKQGPTKSDETQTKKKEIYSKHLKSSFDFNHGHTYIYEKKSGANKVLVSPNELREPQVQNNHTSQIIFDDFSKEKVNLKNRKHFRSISENFMANPITQKAVEPPKTKIVKATRTFVSSDNFLVDKSNKPSRQNSLCKITNQSIEVIKNYETSDAKYLKTETHFTSKFSPQIYYN